MSYSLNPKLRGTYFVDDYGAVALAFSAPHPGPTDPMVTANVVAINAALAAVHAAGGGTLYFGNGVYFTNAAVGFDVNADTNVSITVQGAGPFPVSMIYCLTTTEPLFKLHNQSPNIRNIYIKDMSFVGGRQNLSLVLCWYSRFERCWFWGASQFALQMQNSGLNEFISCYFPELDTGGGVGDAVYMRSASAEFTGCTFGEGGGGIINDSSFLQITGGTIFQSWYKGSPATDYWTTPGTPVDFPLTGGSWFAQKPTIVANGEVGLLLTGVRIYARFLGVHCEYSHRITISGCQFLSDPVTPGDGQFVGFIKLYNYVGDTAIIVSGCQFILISNGVTGDSGYLIYEPSNLVHDAVIEAQVIIPPGASLTALSVSAPALLNPGSENNLVNVRQFHSTSI